MIRRKTSYTFAQVNPTEAVAAFSFHENAATEHIWPRTLEDIRRYSESGHLFGIKSDEAGGFVALCYAILDEDTQEWEVGGLIVAKPFRRGGLGIFLVRMALAHTMVFQQPWANDQRIIAHVHEANDKPRGLLEEVGFIYSKSVEPPIDIVPGSMLRNEAGKVVGHEFEFPPDGLKRLSHWLNNEFDGTLGTDMEINIDLGPAADIEFLRAALTSMAESL